MLDHVASLVADDGGEILPAMIAAERSIQRPLCYYCGDEVYLCHGRLGGWPYYAHYPQIGRDEDSATYPEDDLHRARVREIFAFLKGRHARGRPFAVQYTCLACGDEHQIDLLAGTTAITTETHVRVAGQCIRPDVAALTGNRLRAVWEIIHRHSVPQRNLTAYRAKSVVVVESGIAVSFAPPARIPQHARATAYEARRLSGERPKGDLSCRVHWVAPVCPDHRSIMLRQPHLIVR